MKKIVELCSKDNNGIFLHDAVKLRLRGRGSGYKEGPYNRGKLLYIIIESDEPLHLCISSKYLDRYRKACSLVQELVSGVYDEYRRYCERTGRYPTNCLYVQKEESISSRKGNNSYSGQVINDKVYVDN
jgi:hypothetical protein